MERDAAPHIELYMYSLNQEFPVGKGHVTFLKKSSELKIDSKTGEIYTQQNVESQVFYTGDPDGRRLSSTKMRLPEAKPDADASVDEISAAAGRPTWTAQWIQNGWVAQWLQNSSYTNSCEPIFAAAFSDPLENIKVREEDFGGILYNPISDRVYKVNHAGLELFNEFYLAHRTCSQDLRYFRSSKFAAEDVSRFIEYLRAESIWEPRP